MATTTNYGWTTPDNTDLVKDGAAAIRTLGSAIDTSLVDLRGGTTGQVLKKASNTQMDFEWGTASSGLTLINTTSFSAVASQSVNNVFSSTYDSYIINVFNGSSTTGGTLRLRASGTDNSSSVYLYRGSDIPDTAFQAARQNAGTSFFLQNLTASTIFIKNPADNSNTYFANSAAQPYSASSSSSHHLVGAHFANYVADGFTIFISSGTMTGSVSVYGYNK